MSIGEEYLQHISKDHYPVVRDILKLALEKLSKRGGWTRFANAKDKKGKMVPIPDKDACSFCAMGAIVKAWHDVYLKDERAKAWHDVYMKDKKTMPEWEWVVLPEWVISGYLKDVLVEKKVINQQVIDQKSFTPGLVHWNDYIVKRKSQVLRAFEIGIKAIEEEMEKAE